LVFTASRSFKMRYNRYCYACARAARTCKQTGWQ